MPHFSHFAGVLAIVLTASASTARADHFNSLFQAADLYRDAMREFERASDRAHCLSAFTERTVDRLYGAANSFRSAARHPENVERLLDRWYELNALKDQVDAALATEIAGAMDPRLGATWNGVLRTYLFLAREMDAYAGVPAPLGFDPRFPLDPVPQIAPLPRTIPPTNFPLFGDRSFNRQRLGFGLDRSGVIAVPLPACPANVYDRGPVYNDRYFGQRQTRDRRGELLSIGAQLMRLMD